MFCFSLLACAVGLTAVPPARAGVAAAYGQQPCRSARAVHDRSCPNYTGFQHAISKIPIHETAVEHAARAVRHAAHAVVRKGRALQRGTASWYGRELHGAKTASGERFNRHDLTAAHKTLPLGSRVLVHNERTGRDVVVRINDRGPHARNRIIDLSKAAAEAIGMMARGHDTVVLHALAPDPNGAAVSHEGVANSALQADAE